MNKFAPVLFRFRGYIPLPFLLTAVVFASPTVPSLLFGVGLVLTGELVRLWAVSLAGSETRSTRSLTGTRLITGGPFAHVRNPLYLGNIVIYIGIGVMSMAAFPWLIGAALVWFSVQYFVIVSYEEQFLADRFGSDYQHYRMSVNRFLPSIRKYKASSDNMPSSSVLRGLRSERRTIQAETLVTILLVSIYLVRHLRG